MQNTPMYAAYRRYLKQFLTALVAYIASLMLAIRLIPNYAHVNIASFCLALTPSLPLAFRIAD